MILTGLLTGLLLAATPQAGEVAPDFTTTDTDGKALHLADLVKEGPVIVAFFPKAFTGGCTQEMKNYRDRHADVLEAKGRVIAISNDDTETMKKFKDSLKAPFSFVADPDAKIINAYDVKTPVLGFAKRYTFVVGDDRKVLKVTSGSDAVDVTGAVEACPLRKAKEAAPAAPPAAQPAPAAPKK